MHTFSMAVIFCDLKRIGKMKSTILTRHSSLSSLRSLTRWFLWMTVRFIKIKMIDQASIAVTMFSYININMAILYYSFHSSSDNVTAKEQAWRREAKYVQRNGNAFVELGHN